MRLIDAEALKKALAKNLTIWAFNTSYDGVLAEVIDNAPTVDLKDIYQEGHYDGHLEGYTKAINEERPQGEWIKDTSGYYSYFRCNNCNSYCSSVKTNFCPNCGADMKGEDQ